MSRYVYMRASMSHTTSWDVGNWRWREIGLLGVSITVQKNYRTTKDATFVNCPFCRPWRKHKHTNLFHNMGNTLRISIYKIRYCTPLHVLNNKGIDWNRIFHSVLEGKRYLHSLSLPPLPLSFNWVDKYLPLYKLNKDQVYNFHIHCLVMWRYC